MEDSVAWRENAFCVELDPFSFFVQVSPVFMFGVALVF